MVKFVYYTDYLISITSTILKERPRYTPSERDGSTYSSIMYKLGGLDLENKITCIDLTFFIYMLGRMIFPLIIILWGAPAVA